MCLPETLTTRHRQKLTFFSYQKVNDRQTASRLFNSLRVTHKVVIKELGLQRRKPAAANPKRGCANLPKRVLMHAQVELDRDMNILAVADKQTRLLVWQGMTLDLDQQTVYAGDTAIAASPAEFSLLRLLITRRNIPLAKDFIMAALFGPDHGRDLRQADFFIARLRRRLTPFGFGDAISTIAGRGYAILEEDRATGPRVDCLALAAA